MKRIYFKSIKGKRSEPMDLEQIKTNLYKNDLIWYEGINDWTKASEIDELKKYAIQEPPTTKSEKNNKILIKSIIPTITIYFLLSFITGVSSGLLEKSQYNTFQKKIDEQVEYLKSEGRYYNSSGFDALEIYVSKHPGGKMYTRWGTYNRNRDNEQVSYEARYKLFLRSYKAFFSDVNLSKKERDNNFILLGNFLFSAFVTNLILLPFIYFIVFKIKKTTE